MTIKKMYCYFFYKLFKFWEICSSPKFFSEWKAIVTMLALEVWVILSVFNYYAVFQKKDLIPNAINNPLTYLGLTGLVSIKIYLFEYKDKWRDYIKEFDTWSKKTNTMGTLFTWSIVLIIVSNLIVSFYLLSQSR